MAEIPIPEGLILTPQQWRVYTALQDWADKRTIQRAINDPDGAQRYTPPVIAVSKVKTKIAPFGLTVESEGTRYRTPQRWRIVQIEQSHEAAA